jgi:serine/threonine-protein kinase
VVYAAAAGRAPYPGGNADEVRQRMAQQELESPSSLAAEMPRRLEEILIKALGRAPEQRHQTVAELVNELETVAI